MIQRQEIFNIIDLFTAQSTINFYESIFDNIDLSSIAEFIEFKTWTNRLLTSCSYTSFYCYEL